MEDSDLPAGLRILKFRGPLHEESREGSASNVHKAAAASTVDYTVYDPLVMTFWDPRSDHPRAVTTIHGGGILRTEHIPT